MPSINTQPDLRCLRLKWRRHLCILAAALVFFLAPAHSSRAAEKEISFQTADGVMLYGMYGAPEGAEGKASAVIFLHSFEHDRRAYGQSLYPGLSQIIPAGPVSQHMINVPDRDERLRTH